MFSYFAVYCLSRGYLLATTIVTKVLWTYTCYLWAYPRSTATLHLTIIHFLQAPEIRFHQKQEYLGPAFNQPFKEPTSLVSEQTQSHLEPPGHPTLPEGQGALQKTVKAIEVRKPSITLWSATNLAASSRKVAGNRCSEPGALPRQRELSVMGVREQPRENTKSCILLDPLSIQGSFTEHQGPLPRVTSSPVSMPQVRKEPTRLPRNSSCPWALSAGPRSPKDADL